ncbi:MAG: hypothetical protein HY692_01205, partial [Cyanobacteria bacterium NC_groundwater_1444_Ag_S-0.65um_54_12]|nr:hypothetical protein [Cyanobacteria bacterium NC_groundwater_1444_Ag_S-0.65um_54_12]
MDNLLLATRIVTERLSEVVADGLVIGLFEGWQPDSLANDPLLRSIKSVWKLKDFQGKLKETIVLYPEGLRFPRLLLVGLGQP